MNKHLYKRALANMIRLEGEKLAKLSGPEEWMSKGRQSLNDLELLIGELRDEILNS